MNRIISYLIAGLLPVFILLTPAGNSIAQENIMLHTRVVDAVTGEGIPFCPVTLLQTADSSVITESADSSGSIMVSPLQPAVYRLSIDYPGYRAVDTVLSFIQQPMLTIEVVRLQPVAHKLDDVVIVEQKKMVEFTTEGLVYNADQDGANRGIMADDLLRRVPMVTVDLEGNVSLRGSEGVKVLIDGKPGTLIAATVKDALKQIPGDIVRSVEVITTPGARYEGEGTSGIINIITKKNRVRGISGSVFGSSDYLSDRNTLNGFGGANINLRSGKFGFGANAGGGSWRGYTEMDVNRTDELAAGARSLSQAAQIDARGRNAWSSVYASYEFDTLNAMQVGFNFNPGETKQHSVQDSRYPGQDLDFTRYIDRKNTRNNYGVNATYTRVFKDHPKHTLDIMGLYTNGRNPSRYELLQHNNLTGSNDYEERNENTTSTIEYTFQADYTHPFKKAGRKLEAGLKFINRDLGSDYRLDYRDAGNGAAFVNDPNRTNVLDYNQSVSAAYTQFATKLTERVSATLGLRYEFTDIDARLHNNGGSFGSRYHNVLPNVSLSMRMRESDMLKVSYNQRIERPSIGYINPFINYADPLNISYGNPDLDPELAHNFDISYNAMKDQSVLGLSTFYRYTGNAIEMINKVNDDGVNTGTYGNIAAYHVWGLNLHLSTKLFDRWSFNVNGNLYYKNLESKAYQVNNNGFQYDYSVYSNFRLTSKAALEAFTRYQGNSVALQGRQSGWYYYTFKINYIILKGKGDITLEAENVFRPFVNVENTYNYQNARYTSETRRYFRGLSLSFNYRFGKMEFKERRKIKNDDLKPSSGDN